MSEFEVTRPKMKLSEAKDFIAMAEAQGVEELDMNIVIHPIVPAPKAVIVLHPNKSQDDHYIITVSCDCCDRSEQLILNVQDSPLRKAIARLEEYGWSLLETSFGILCRWCAEKKVS